MGDSPCGPSETCAMTMTLTPDHQKTLTGIDKWVEFEFKTPVPVEKHTTYFVNVAVVGNTDVSKEVIWYSGAALGDGRYSLAHTGDTNKPADELRASFTRDKTTWRWVKNPNTVQALKFRRCVTSTANVMGFSVSGEKTGCCSARASPQGGDKGAEVIITGRNFFPSDHLKCVFRNENGMGGMVVPGKVLDASYTKMSCKAPTHNPHSSRDCTNQALCKGVELLVTNDGFTTGPQYMGPKWKDPVSTSAIPASLGQNPLKFLFSDIHVSPTGSDVTGDGTVGRPYATIQRAVDAANEYDQVVLMSGTYVGLGNRGLRHHGKRSSSSPTTCAPRAPLAPPVPPMVTANLSSSIASTRQMASSLTTTRTPSPPMRAGSTHKTSSLATARIFVFMISELTHGDCAPERRVRNAANATPPLMALMCSAAALKKCTMKKK